MIDVFVVIDVWIARGLAAREASVLIAKLLAKPLANPRCI